MITKHKLKAELEQLRQDNAMLKLLTRAYMRKTAELEDDLAMVNASLDAAIADKERWQEIAQKADERRKRYVLNNMAGTD